MDKTLRDFAHKVIGDKSLPKPILLFLTPEGLISNFEKIEGLYQNGKLTRIVIDEAQCVTVSALLVGMGFSDIFFGRDHKMVNLDQLCVANICLMYDHLADKFLKFIKLAELKLKFPTVPLTLLSGSMGTRATICLISKFQLKGSYVICGPPDRANIHYSIIRKGAEHREQLISFIER